jgi:hypothetical protein
LVRIYNHGTILETLLTLGTLETLRTLEAPGTLETLLTLETLGTLEILTTLETLTSLENTGNTENTANTGNTGNTRNTGNTANTGKLLKYWSAESVPLALHGPPVTHKLIMCAELEQVKVVGRKLHSVKVVSITRLHSTAWLHDKNTNGVIHKA